MQRWKLVAVVAAVAAVVIASVLVLILTGGGQQIVAPTPTATSDGPRINPGPMDGPTASPTPIRENLPSGQDGQNQVKVCNNYLDQFLRPGTEEERRARLREWGTPQNVEQAAATDPRRLSSARRKGDCAIDSSTATSNQVQAHVQLTDGTWWACTLVKDITAPSQWRVHAMTREGH